MCLGVRARGEPTLGRGSKATCTFSTYLFTRYLASGTIVGLSREVPGGSDRGAGAIGFRASLEYPNH
jgi:hypothetical protein